MCADSIQSRNFIFLFALEANYIERWRRSDSKSNIRFISIHVPNFGFQKEIRC
jgi:hypothetical protein